MPFSPWTDDAFGEIICRDIMVAGDDKARPLQTVKKSSCRLKFPRSGTLCEVPANNYKVWLDIGKASPESVNQLRRGPAKVEIRNMDKGCHGENAEDF